MIGEVRRSKRINNKERTNYFELATGGTLHTTEGNTAVAQHVTRVHSKDSIESKILATESSWYRRGIKEALAILKHQPKLNEDHGRHPISQIIPLSPNITSAEPKLSAQEPKTQILTKDQAPVTNFAHLIYHLQTKWRLEKPPGTFQSRISEEEASSSLEMHKR